MGIVGWIEARVSESVWQRDFYYRVNVRSLVFIAVVLTTTSQILRCVSQLTDCSIGWDLLCCTLREAPESNNTWKRTCRSVDDDGECGGVSVTLYIGSGLHM